MLYESRKDTKMSTPHRTEINRANAQHSTGPKTEAGKQRSRLNAMKYGFTGQLVVMPTEDMELYEVHKKSFEVEYQPQGATEEHLVQSLADVSWRLNRVALLESNLLSICYTPRDLVDGLFDQAKALANLSMHSQRLSRQFERTVAQLRDLQKARRIQEKDADNLTEMRESQGEKYNPSQNPSQDGFVFSSAQIDPALRARNPHEYQSEAA
jgi:hypothetical protein